MQNGIGRSSPRVVLGWDGIAVYGIYLVPIESSTVQHSTAP